eukprot:4344057-Amphidinium_carterae.1
MSEGPRQKAITMRFWSCSIVALSIYGSKAERSQEQAAPRSNSLSKLIVSRLRIVWLSRRLPAALCVSIVFCNQPFQYASYLGRLESLSFRAVSGTTISQCAR